MNSSVVRIGVVQAILLQPLPFPQPERLVRIFDNRAGAKDVGMSVPEFEDLRRHSDIFEQFSVIFPAPTALTGAQGMVSGFFSSFASLPSL